MCLDLVSNWVLAHSRVQPLSLRALVDLAFDMRTAILYSPIAVLKDFVTM